MKTCSKCGEDHESKNYYYNKCRAMMAKVIREKHKANGTKPTPRSELRKFNYDDPNQYALFNGARGRARKNDIPFDIEPKDIIIPTHCPILGTKLIPGDRPNAPSLDRIIPDRGYTKDNIQVISYRANMLKSNITLAESMKITEWLYSNNLP